MSFVLTPRHRVTGMRSLRYGSSASTLGWLNYLRHESPRPVSYACEPPPGTPWESAGYDAYPVQIHDIRQLPAPYRSRGFRALACAVLRARLPR